MTLNQEFMDHLLCRTISGDLWHSYSGIDNKIYHCGEKYSRFSSLQCLWEVSSQAPQLSLLCLQAQSSGRDLKLGGDGTDSENQPLSLIYDPQP